MAYPRPLSDWLLGTRCPYPTGTLPATTPNNLSNRICSRQTSGVSQTRCFAAIWATDSADIGGFERESPTARDVGPRFARGTRLAQMRGHLPRGTRHVATRATTGRSSINSSKSRRESAMKNTCLSTGPDRAGVPKQVKKATTCRVRVEGRGRSYRPRPSRFRFRHSLYHRGTRSKRRFPPRYWQTTSACGTLNYALRDFDPD